MSKEFKIEVYPEDIRDTLCAMANVQSSDDRQSIVDAMYNLACVCKNPLNNDYFRSFYNVLERIANMYTVNTQLEYMYRDEGNYKQWKTVILCGKMTKKEFEELMSLCDPDGNFIPEAVGLPFDFENAYLPFAELHSFNETIETPTTDLSVEDLMKNFRDAQAQWNCA